MKKTLGRARLCRAVGIRPFSARQSLALPNGIARSAINWTKIGMIRIAAVGTPVVGDAALRCPSGQRSALPLPS
jgi:hypothetical protein